MQPFHQNFWAWLECFIFDYKLWAWLKIQGFWDFWVLNVDLQVWKIYITLYSLHIIFEIPIFGGYFKLSSVKIKMGIYSEHLPGRNSRWLFSVIVIARGNFEKKNHSNHDHFEWWFQSDHDHQKSWFPIKWSSIPWSLKELRRSLLSLKITLLRFALLHALARHR